MMANSKSPIILQHKITALKTAKPRNLIKACNTLYNVRRLLNYSTPGSSELDVLRDTVDDIKYVCRTFHAQYYDAVRRKYEDKMGLLKAATDRATMTREPVPAEIKASLHPVLSFIQVLGDVLPPHELKAPVQTQHFQDRGHTGRVERRTTDPFRLPRRRLNEVAAAGPRVEGDDNSYAPGTREQQWGDIFERLSLDEGVHNGDDSPSVRGSVNAAEALPRPRWPQETQEYRGNQGQDQRRDRYRAQDNGQRYSGQGARPRDPTYNTGQRPQTRPQPNGLWQPRSQPEQGKPWRMLKGCFFCADPHHFAGECSLYRNEPLSRKQCPRCDGFHSSACKQRERRQAHVSFVDGPREDEELWEDVAYLGPSGQHERQ